MKDLSAPKLESIISKKIDRRKGNHAKTAIVIATYQNPEVLKKHLDLLEKQSFKDFDIIIVYGENDNFLDGAPEDILHIKEKGRNGCAGAFYIGQKTALDEGYENIISADDDCFPVSETLVEELVRRVQKENTIAIPKWRRDKEKIQHEYVFHYSCIPQKILRKSGLPFYPLFFGGDDVEMIERIKKMGINVEHTEATTYHELLEMPLTDNTQKRYLYSRGGFEAWLLLGNYARAFLFCFFHLTGATSFLIFRKNERAKGIVSAMINGSLMEFGNKKIPAADDVIVVEYKKKSLDVVVDKSSDPSKLRYGSIFAGFPRLIRWPMKSLLFFQDFKKYFGKTVVFVKRYERIHLPIMLMAKSAYLQGDEKTYELYKDRGKIGIIFGMLIMLILVPSVVVSSLFLVVIGIISSRNIKTLGYGID
ncbi:glycosyltransferase [Candidatus Micrarchaeota archaeon]|nr:glycosyltransferase [Candidatus Micrarchaeota archaeon]MBU1681226.1 glycosyltransferase [Candidatus Micrarchaeota archaeon]